MSTMSLQLSCDNGLARLLVFDNISWKMLKLRILDNDGQFPLCKRPVFRIILTCHCSVSQPVCRQTCVTAHRYFSFKCVLAFNDI